MIQFDSCVFFKWIGETTTNFCVSLCGDFFAPPKKKRMFETLQHKKQQDTPQKFNSQMPKMALFEAGVTFSNAHHFGYPAVSFRGCIISKHQKIIKQQHHFKAFVLSRKGKHTHTHTQEKQQEQPEILVCENIGKYHNFRQLVCWFHG